MDQTLQNLSDHQPVRNPQTEALHKREVLLQITVPLIVGVSVFVGFVFLAIFASAGAKSQGADVALMWLLCMPMLFTLLASVLMGALVYGLWRLLAILPSSMFQVQNFFYKVQGFVRMFADKLVEPFLKANSASASASALWHSLFKKGS